MRLLKTVLDFYIRSSLHVAICFVALSCVIIGWKHVLIENLAFSGMQFCLIVTSYNFVKYFELFRKNKIFRFKYSILILSFMSGILSLILLLPELRYIYFFIIALTGLVLLYVYPIGLSKNLRKFTFLKLPVVALCWVLLIASYGYSKFIINESLAYGSFQGITNCFGPWPSFWIFEKGFYLYLSIFFFFILALCIPFEIRDLKYDQKDLGTLPQSIGIINTKRIGYLLLMISFLILIFHRNLPFYLNSMHGITEVTIYFLTALAIYFSDKFKSDYYASFFVEAVPLLWLGLYWFL